MVIIYHHVNRIFILKHRQFPLIHSSFDLVSYMGQTDIRRNINYMKILE